MNKRIVRLLATILTLVMLLSALAGCGGGDTTTTTAPADSSSGDQTGETTEEEREIITLDAFIMQSVASTFGISEHWLAEVVKEELGIQIEFMPTGDQVDQKLQALMASGELPDIVGFKENKLAVAAIEANMLLSLDANKEALPNIFENEDLKHAVNYYRDQVSAGKNELFMMPSAVGPLGATSDTNWKPQLMWKVYQDIGAPEINTLEDYLDVVKQMQDAYPVNEAGEKVYGFQLFSDWDSFNALEVATLSFFYGIDTEYVSPLMETQVTTHEIGSILDEDSFYKRALDFYFQANQMGLLDPDSLTQKFDTVQEKLSAGRVLFTPFSWLTGSFNDRGSGNVTADEPNGFEMIPAADMKIYDAPYQSVGRPWTFAISAATEHPERALEFLNWFYDFETSMLVQNGPEGVIWEMQDGEPVVTDEGWDIIDNNKEMPLPGGGLLKDGGMDYNTMPFVAAFINPETNVPMGYRYWPTSLSRNPTKLKEAWREWADATTTIEYLKKNDMVSPASQAINMIPAAPDDLQMVMNQIGDVVKTNSWKMVFAKDEAEFNALWEDMVTKANGLGIEQVNTYYEDQWQQALDLVSKYED